MGGSMSLMKDNASREFYETVARFYDAETASMTEDLAFYSGLAAETGGPVLDVGCGTGRVMLHLAQEGLRVVGVDVSEAMLARARRKLAVLPDLRDSVTLLQGDVLEVGLAERFGLVAVPYNGFMHFRTQEAQLRALERMRDWLLPGGLLVLDLPNPGVLYATTDDDSLVLERMFVEPETDHLVMQQSVSRLDRAGQIMHVTWIYDEVFEDGAVHRTLAPIALRYVFPAEMDLLLRVAGLRRIEPYGDYDSSPFEDASPRMIVLAKARE